MPESEMSLSCVPASEWVHLWKVQCALIFPASIAWCSLCPWRILGAAQLSLPLLSSHCSLQYIWFAPIVGSPSDSNSCSFPNHLTFPHVTRLRAAAEECYSPISHCSISSHSSAPCCRSSCDKGKISDSRECFWLLSSFKIRGDQNLPLDFS